MKDNRTKLGQSLAYSYISTCEVDPLIQMEHCLSIFRYKAHGETMKKNLVPVLSIIILTISACATPTIAPGITEQPLEPTAVPPIVATEAGAPVALQPYTIPLVQDTPHYT